MLTDLILGTAGHIDHGKTALTKALTGIDTDRLPEEKKRGITIASISGCSIGSLIGGVYAAGKLDEFEHWVRAISKMDMVNLLDLSWARHGLVKGDKIIGTLVELVGDQLIEDLPIPYTAIAADIKNEKEVWLNSGRLFDAIRASISLPLFFTPVPRKDTFLIDGGVLNPVPIAPTFGDGTDLTIAVNLGGPATTQPAPAPKPANAAQDDKTLRGRVERFVRELQSSDEENEADTLGAYAIADQPFDAMQSTIARQKLAAYPPDIVIEIARNACGTFDFDRAAEIIEFGRVAASDSLDKYSD